MTPRGLGNNLEVMEVDPTGLRAIVISHGHVDHQPPPSRADLEAEGLEVVEERGPTLLVDGRPADPRRPEPDRRRRRQGLVVVSGCSHAGAVNMLRNAQRLTGRQRIVGFGVERLVPGHCTGWKATHRLAQALPDASVQLSVGTVLRF